MRLPSLLLRSAGLTTFLLGSSLPSAFAQQLEGSPEVHREMYSTPRRIDGLRPGTRALGATSSLISCDNAPDGDGPHELAFLADGSAVVIAHKDSDNLAFFDVNTRTVTHTVPVGDIPVQVAVTPKGNTRSRRASSRTPWPWSTSRPTPSPRRSRSPASNRTRSSSAPTATGPSSA